MTAWLFSAFISLLVVERGFELWLSHRNAAWARSAGAIEYGQRHLIWMKLLHTSFFVACLSEVWLLSPPFIPALGGLCLVAVLGSQALRYWVIATLGRRWNVAVLVLPGVSAVSSGPFRFLKHPNYLAVVVEGIAVPLLHSAYLTAICFSALNAWLLAVRIRCEENALAVHADYAERLGDRGRLLPTRSSRA